MLRITEEKQTTFLLNGQIVIIHLQSKAII